MDVLLLGARLVLAGVFGVAGAAKLLDRSGTREGLVSFGIPPRLGSPLSVVLPVAELAIAAALVPRVSAWWGGLAALGLLVSFSSAIALNLARGNRPECRCFGQLRASPVGWPTLLRNTILAALAALIVGMGWRDSGLSVIDWRGSLPSSEPGLAVMVLLALVLLGTVVGMLARVFVQQAR